MPERGSPEAPIGIGTKWSVTRPIKSQGVDSTRVAVYELTKFENGTGTMKVNVEQSTQPQDVKVEGQPGVKQRVIKMTTTSTGAHDFSLTKILPRMGSLRRREAGDAP
jgi:hypothetical protein